MEVVLLVLVAALCLGVLRRHWWLTRVRGWSMYPTLRPGDLVATRAVHGRAGLRRGDLVVLDAPGGGRVVKRIVGLPGEQVRVTPGGVWIDGQPLAEPFVTLPGGGTRSFQVPQDGYLVLGDNRRHSTDSRAWTDPYPTRAAIRGRLTGRPLGRRPLPTGDAVPPVRAPA